MDSGCLVLGFPLLYLSGMRIVMFQLSGFYFESIPFSSLHVCANLFQVFEALNPEPLNRRPLTLKL